MNKPLYLQAFERLPERFRKPNTKDLYYVLYNGSDEIESAYQTIKDSHSIDKAFGQTLDLLGSNVGEFRQEGMDDDLYRLYIKVRIISNLSIGDIPTINYVMSTLLGDKYLSIVEGYLDKEFLENEPAALRLSILNSAKRLPYDVMDRIKAAGIRILIDEIYATELKLESRSGDNSYLIYLCGEHPCGDIPYPWAVGEPINIGLGLKTGVHDSNNYYGYAGNEWKAGELRRDEKDVEVRYVQNFNREDVYDFGGDL
ncbi:hypothetical protein ES702_00971 [subsurface metagenome]